MFRNRGAYSSWSSLLLTMGAFSISLLTNASTSSGFDCYMRRKKSIRWLRRAKQKHNSIYRWTTIEWHVYLHVDWVYNIVSSSHSLFGFCFGLWCWWWQSERGFVRIRVVYVVQWFEGWRWNWWWKNPSGKKKSGDCKNSRKEEQLCPVDSEHEKDYHPPY